jgi:hypothetical protein
MFEIGFKRSMNKLTLIAGSPTWLHKYVPMCIGYFCVMPMWWWTYGLLAILVISVWGHELPCRQCDKFEPDGVRCGSAVSQMTCDPYNYI